jgi:hypothetical protein
MGKLSSIVKTFSPCMSTVFGQCIQSGHKYSEIIEYENMKNGKSASQMVASCYAAGVACE